MILYKDETEATPYMLDLLHDRNTEVQRVCDATLQMIGEISPDWSQKLMAEKFRCHKKIIYTSFITSCQQSKINIFKLFNYFGAININASYLIFQVS